MRLSSLLKNRKLFIRETTSSLGTFVLPFSRAEEERPWVEPKERLLQLPPTPRQNVYACARLSISGLFFSHTFQSDQSLPRALGFILCVACGSVPRVFDYFVVIEIVFMDNQAQITETIGRLDSEKVR